MAVPARVELHAGRGAELITDGTSAAHLAAVDRRLSILHSKLVEQVRSGLATLVEHQRAWVLSHEWSDDLGAMARLADRVRNEFEVFVVVGVGGSNLGARVIHDAVGHPQHNLVSREERGGAPEVYFTGDTFDPKRLSGLLASLKSRGLLHRSVFNIVSKSGTTAETLTTGSVINEWLEAAGLDWRRHAIATTGLNEASVLYRLHQERELFGILPVPEGVGGRFSFVSTAGLLLGVTADGRCETPAGRIAAAVEGYREAHERFLLPPDKPANIACHLARLLHVAEAHGDRDTVLLYNFADDRMLGDWFIQLWAESLQERGAGMNVMAVQGPTANHSILNGILRGRRDKAVVFIRWEDLGEHVTVPRETAGIAELERFAGLSLNEIQDAAWHSTAEDFTADGIPNVTLSVGRRDAKHLFCLMRLLMDAVAVKGRLQGLYLDDGFAADYARELTYRQDGVEGYKRRMREKLVRA